MNHQLSPTRATLRTAVGTLCFLAAGLAALPATAQEYGYASKTIHLRAGPSRDYPLVVSLAPRTALTVIGCLPDYRWCDVAAGPYRGWAHSSGISYAYQGRNVPLLTYGPTLGIGITSFMLGNYWDNHYRSAPWYGQRHRWVERPQPRPDFRQDPGYRVAPGHDYRGDYRGGHYAPQAQMPAPAHSNPAVAPRPAPAPAARVEQAPARGPSGDPGDKRTSRDLTQGAER